MTPSEGHPWIKMVVLVRGVGDGVDRLDADAGVAGPYVDHWKKLP